MKQKYESYRQEPKAFRRSIWKYVSDPYRGGEVSRYFLGLWQKQNTTISRKMLGVLNSGTFKGIVVVVIVSLLIVTLKKDKENNTIEVFIDNLESVGIASAAIIYILKISDRRKRKHYEAWQVISTAESASDENGLRPSGGRIEALQDLVNDNVDLAGVASPKALLTEINLKGGRLKSSDFSGRICRVLI